jgi:hypothetical protein
VLLAKSWEVLRTHSTKLQHVAIPMAVIANDVDVGQIIDILPQ